jgi:hypothetical protein
MSEELIVAEIQVLRMLMRATAAQLRVIRESAAEHVVDGVSICGRIGCEAPAVYHFHMCEEHRCRGCPQPSMPPPTAQRNPIRRSTRLKTTHDPLGPGRRQ